MRKGLRKLHEALLRKATRRPHAPKIRVTEDQQGRHDVASWGRRFGRALRFLFPAERPARVVRSTRKPAGLVHPR